MNKSICLALAVWLAIFGIGYSKSHTEKTYGADATVMEVVGSTVSVVDETGEGWQFYGEGYHVGEPVRLIMSNSATPDRIDDTILRAVTL